MNLNPYLRSITEWRLGLKKSKIKLKVNDKIVHITYGAGIVIGCSIKKLGGTKQVFYEIKTDEQIYWLPITNSHPDQIRHVRAPSTFRNALSIIRKKPKKLSNDFGLRIKHINDELVKFSLVTKAKLIRDMQARNLEKSLHVYERQTLKKLKTQFINEWSISANISKAEAEEKLNYALLESIRRI